MKILVYGAGVIGSYLAHTLINSGNEVTVLARGNRFKQLNEDGLKIEHYFQKKVTVDSPKIITTLPKEEYYDVIFVVMKYNQFFTVFDSLSENISENIVFVGNNANPKKMERELKIMAREKNIGFGFQTSAGKRLDTGEIISIHGKGNFTFGVLDNNTNLINLIKRVFNDVYKVKIEKDIESWLLTHFVIIGSQNAILQINNYDHINLSKNKMELWKMVNSTKEGLDILKLNNINFTPYILGMSIKRFKFIYYFAMKLYFKLPMNNFVAGGFDEIIALYQEFDKFLKKDFKLHGHWDKLKNDSIKNYSNKEN
ncbi:MULTISPECIES: ketopantoate reductase family protein [Staphylococcaceae]|uniref:ketopantoate reductase family protein n=1 Tax=Staphylococcaceae TaxID=90964 RepID=UPI000E67BF1F|nr:MULTISPECIES: 2-dehydropantoate 2-reductase N-terminal domain-containing protein [Staphylococcaceae]MCD8837179.1 NAD-binding protein [Mammaliicoccus sciuri]RIO85856.1 ketopantoate reductase family protein [Staphylococcus gallinarum]